MGWACLVDPDGKRIVVNTDRIDVIREISEDACVVITSSGHETALTWDIGDVLCALAEATELSEVILG